MKCKHNWIVVGNMPPAFQHVLWCDKCGSIHRDGEPELYVKAKSFWSWLWQ